MFDLGELDEGRSLQHFFEFGDQIVDGFCHFRLPAGSFIGGGFVGGSGGFQFHDFSVDQLDLLVSDFNHPVGFVDSAVRSRNGFSDAADLGILSFDYRFVISCQFFPLDVFGGVFCVGFGLLFLQVGHQAFD